MDEALAENELYQLYIYDDPKSFLCLLLLMPLFQTNSINETKSKLDYIVCANGITENNNHTLKQKHHEQFSLHYCHTFLYWMGGWLFRF